MSARPEATTRDGDPRAPRLTVTSFAVLGLLAMGEWTTYELAQQMRRSFSHFWPRAERGIYDEPRRLASAGYVEDHRETVGRRPRTRWRITAAGLDALRAWLDEPPGAAPTLEFEGMVKVFLAPYGSKRQLLDTLARIGEAAADQQRQLAAMSAELAADGGRFPERVHVNALAMRFIADVAAVTERWAREAEGAVADWHATAAPGERARKAARADFAALSAAVPPAGRR